MSLTRRMLKAMGIEEEKIDEIINAHTETVDALKNERDRYKEDADTYKTDSERLEDVQKELNDLKAEKESGNPYEVKYNDLKKEYEGYKTSVEAEKIKAKKTAAYKKLLKDAGVSDRRIDAVLKVSSAAIDSVEFDEDDSVKNSKDLTDKVNEEWADFIETTGTRGADVNTPPSGTGSSGNAGIGLSRAAMIAQKHNQSVWGAPKGEDK